MSTAAIIYLVLMGVGLLYTSYKHGQQKTEKHNIWVSLISTLIILSLLNWGGFFN